MVKYKNFIRNKVLPIWNENNHFIGGDKRIRTADICLAKAALYQLSYTPCLTELLTLILIRESDSLSDLLRSIW
jgi:hypothetical protein